MESVHLSPHCRHEPRRRRVVRRFSFLWVNPSRAFPSPANDSAGWKWELKGFQGFRAFTRPRKNQVFIRETRHEQPLDNARNLTFTLIAAFCHAIFRENNLRRGGGEKSIDSLRRESSAKFSQPTGLPFFSRSLPAISFRAQFFNQSENYSLVSIRCCLFAFLLRRPHKLHLAISRDKYIISTPTSLI